jgi:maltose alpha-D-glucosyltransferase/alpha-amylase
MPDSQTLVTDPVPQTVTDWYKDAVIYQLHIKAFYDSNNDGVGDFTGLTEKLDYIKDLGVNTIWLLPFYPSPLRDDGYDISDFTAVNPTYGTMEDFQHFIAKAHARGLKVITELVINHTSDQHPWFQRARAAPAGSPERDWYVWSDTDTKYAGTRIIFQDTEKSNWTWEPVAKAYFWHRFFSHQPDLNFDNPEVMKAVIEAMYFWLELGVDGLRLDAIPYLVERDGTSNENIPETHAVIKTLRKALDAKFPDRFFLAEANMWPEDVIQYFGEDDECHMAFHFPLMPRMYMAIAREDRHPITDIMRQTPDISPQCQWAIFLRNHDELTLEMVTDKERDYLWETYATDKRARLNLGIRRRLAPLMDNDRRKIELMNSLLLSMPGTPILYYGDELCMGDNIYLGDRDGVRTPMQWSPDRNGGFSRSDPARLYLPALMDPTYGYQSLNVEAQSRNTSSPLSWMKRLIAVRQARKCFGRGSIDFLYPENRRVLCYTREYEDETILCLANLSRAAQAVELDLSAWKGRVPVELIGRSRFPAIGELPYLITLPPYGFLWFQLEKADAKVDQPAHLETPPMPDYITLVIGDNPDTLLKGRNKQFLEKNILPKFLPLQRWYPNKDKRLGQIEISDIGMLGQTPNRTLFSLITTRDGETQARYLLPMGAGRGAWPDLPPTVQNRAFAKARKGPQEAIIVDATALPHFASDVIAAIAAKTSTKGDGGTIHFLPAPAMPEGGIPEGVEPKPGSAEQSNSSVIIPGFAMLKFYRHLTIGEQPEVEIGLALSRAPVKANVPPVFGHAELELETGDKAAIAILVGFVENQGDGWKYTLDYLHRLVDQYGVLSEDQATQEQNPYKEYIEFAKKLGQRTAELHLAFASLTEDAFAPEPVKEHDLTSWKQHTKERVIVTLKRLKGNESAAALTERGFEIEGFIDALFHSVPPTGAKIRVHGDYHLGQVLVSGNDVVIVDFEGEPKLPMAERRQKRSPFVDVAGMLRSFDYAAWTALEQPLSDYPARRELLEKLLFTWRDQVTAAFNEAYWSTYHPDKSPQPTPFESALVKLFLLDRGFYEVNYEFANRPGWIHIPLAGIVGLLPPRETKVEDA